uniref:Uncharacterized protein n=1 Tax=Kalanchoe fedtschenkoi TaxID=63787 RepID=A0A7N0VFV9_KALFE
METFIFCCMCDASASAATAAAEDDSNPNFASHSCLIVSGNGTVSEGSSAMESAAALMSHSTALLGWSLPSRSCKS